LTALLLESELSEDQKESLISVKECADLLLHIINSVLDLAKIEAGRLEVESVPFNIGKLVSSTLRMLQARAQERGLQLLWEVDIGVPQVLVGDVGKIQQCLLNLVGNALKFTHKGSVTVRVTVVTDQREISSFGASTDTSVDAGKLCTCVHL
jgi:signal transduction histidine kinase